VPAPTEDLMITWTPKPVVEGDHLTSKPPICASRRVMCAGIERDLDQEVCS